MKKYQLRSILVMSLVLMSTMLAAQNSEKKRLVIALSDPGERGRLEVGQINGSISVEGYNGEEVIVEGESPDVEEGGGGKTPPPGMKRIASNPVRLSARQDENVVEVNTESWKRRMDLTIKVPSNFDLQLHTVHGQIDVKDVNGEMEISGVNGGVSLDGIQGSAVCNTVNGPVKARMTAVTPDAPMSFVTLNGDVDVTLPAGVKAQAKMRSERGEIYSDFDMTISTSEPVSSEGEECDCEYEISINEWTIGEINGGGSEYTFKNMNGDILIRKGN